MLVSSRKTGRIPKNLTPLGHCGICVGGQEGGQQNGRKETQRPGQERDVCMLCLPVGIFGSFEWVIHLRSQTLYVCTRACYAFMFVPVQVPERGRGHPQVPSAFFSRQSLSLAWNSSRKLDWLVSKPQGSFCLTFPSIGTTSLHWLLKFSFILNMIRGN